MLDISPEKTRVGGILYSDKASTLFRLSTYSNKEDVKAAFRAIEYSGGGTNTSGGIKVITQTLSQDQDWRQEMKKLGCLFTIL